MSARAIPESLEAEVVAKHLEGRSLRGISTWLREEKSIIASYEAVSGVLDRHGIVLDDPSRTEPIRQIAERVDDLTDQLFDCLEYYPLIVDECLNPQTNARVSTCLQAVKSWASLVVWGLRAAGAPIPKSVRTPAVAVDRDMEALASRTVSELVNPKPRRTESRKEAEVEVQPARRITSAEPTPPRNAPCPCGSGLKWKKCCGHPKMLALHAAATPGLEAAVSG